MKSTKGAGDAERAVRQIAAQLMTGTPRLWSVVVTVYGDAVLPRGGALWLGTLLSFFEELDVEPGAVRTAMSRLAADGWLERRKVGRNSYYRLAAKGEGVFRQAASHIYLRRAPAWRKAFEVFAAGSLPGEREALRDALQGTGYGLLAPGVWIGAAGSARIAPPPSALRLTARADAETAARLASQVWPAERMAESYRRFLRAFEPLAAAERSLARLSDRQAFAARILMIHAYRRIILHDPMLPDALLPRNWPGAAARDLCAALYFRLLPASERWLDAEGQCESGRLPPAGPELKVRFAD